VLPGFLNSLAGPLGHYGLWAILLLVLLEDFGIPVPGETVLIAGAVYAGSGRLNVVAVGVVGFAAAVVGDNIGYAIGRFGGRTVVERWGRYVFLTSERLDKAEAFFNRHGGKIITIARFIEGLRQANGIIAGIIEMHWLKFLAFNALGAALWVGTWVSVGYFAGQHIEAIYNDITRYSLYAAIAAAVLIVAWIAFRLRKRQLKKAAAAQAAAEASGEVPTPDQAPEAAEGSGAAGAGETAGAAGTSGVAGTTSFGGAADPGRPAGTVGTAETSEAGSGEDAPQAAGTTGDGRDARDAGSTDAANGAEANGSRQANGTGPAGTGEATGYQSANGARLSETADARHSASANDAPPSQGD
jgi:membrane protein DedA with SNARE-associated domain